MESQHARSTKSPSATGSTLSGEAGSLTWLGMASILGVLAIGMLIGAAAAHFMLERPALRAAMARAQAGDVELAALRGKLEQATNKAIAIEGQLLVEESTRRGLETALRSAQEELGQARDTVAFYEELLPPGPKGAVTIRALEVERVGPHLSYRLLLMRSGSHAEPFEGSLQFMARGMLDGEEIELPLTASLEAQADGNEHSAGSALLAVQFENFQRGSGLLALPPGFEPRSITVNVLEGRNIRTSRNLELAVQE